MIEEWMNEWCEKMENGNGKKKSCCCLFQMDHFISIFLFCWIRLFTIFFLYPSVHTHCWFYECYESSIRLHWTLQTQKTRIKREGGRNYWMNEWMNWWNLFFLLLLLSLPLAFEFSNFFFRTIIRFFSLSLSPFSPSLIFVSCEIHNVVDTMDKIDQRKKIFCYSCLD